MPNDRGWPLSTSPARHYRPAPGEVIAALAAIPAAGPGAGEGWLPQPVERLIGQRQVDETADGSSQTYRGSYLVGNGVIQSASVQASS